MLKGACMQWEQEAPGSHVTSIKPYAGNCQLVLYVPVWKELRWEQEGTDSHVYLH